MATSCLITAIRKDLHTTGKTLYDCNEVPGVLVEAEGTVLVCAFNMQLVALCHDFTLLLTLTSQPPQR